MREQHPPDSGPLAGLKPEEKKKRLDAMVRLWQRESEQRLEREGEQAFIAAMGLNEYRYSVWLRFPEWEHSAVVGQVITLRQPRPGAPAIPTLSSLWRHDPLLKKMPDWKARLPEETVFNIIVRITPGSLGEGSKWAVMMPREMIPRYRPGWPTQREWVSWTGEFDWLAVAVGFIHTLLDSL